MIVFEKCNWQKDPDRPDTNFLEGLDCEQPKWVIPDNSELVQKICTASYWEPVTDGEGNLIDIKPVEPPVTPEEQVTELKGQLNAIDMQAVRPLRAIIAGTATEEDRERLAQLEAQAEALRAELKIIYETLEG